MEKEWWEGDGRGEHIIDFALPHEDHEESADDAAAFHAGPVSAIATVACIAVILGLLISTVVLAAHDMI